MLSIKIIPNVLYKPWKMMRGVEISSLNACFTLTLLHTCPLAMWSCVNRYHIPVGCKDLHEYWIYFLRRPLPCFLLMICFCLSFILFMRLSILFFSRTTFSSFLSTSAGFSWEMTPVSRFRQNFSMVTSSIHSSHRLSTYEGTSSVFFRTSPTLCDDFTLCVGAAFRKSISDCALLHCLSSLKGCTK